MSRSIERAISHAKSTAPIVDYERSGANAVFDIVQTIQRLAYPKFSRVEGLSIVSRECAKWLSFLGVDTPWVELLNVHARLIASGAIKSFEVGDSQQQWMLVKQLHKIADARSGDKEKEIDALIEGVSILGALALEWLARELENEADT